jgi:DNA-binding response OmpR family regulator
MNTMSHPISTILVVDDEYNLRRSLALILERVGYVVVTAEGAEQARQYFQDCQFDLVFLDLKMPDINGLDLLSEFHGANPGLPVLILTGHATLESAIEAVRRGARDYLLKPLDPDQIVHRVAEIISEQRASSRRREIVSGIKGLLGELSQLEGLPEWASAIPDGFSIKDKDRFIERGTLNLDLHTRQVNFSGRYISLSPTAFDYLVTLVKHSPEVVSCEDLVAEAQGYRSKGTEAKEIARWRVHELRKALEADPRRPRLIITVRGIGYRLVL